MSSAYQEVDFPIQFARDLISLESETTEWERQLFEANLIAIGPSERQRFAHELGLLWGRNEYGANRTETIRKNFRHWLSVTKIIELKQTSDRVSIISAAAQGMEEGYKEFRVEAK